MNSPAAWWSFLLSPWTTQEDVRTDVARHEHRIALLEEHMADNSQALHDIADGLRSLGQSLAGVLEENRQLRGEDAAESTAAEDVRAAFEDLRGKFEPVAEVPTPEPLPEVPAEPETPSVEPVDEHDPENPPAA